VRLKALAASGSAQPAPAVSVDDRVLIRVDGTALVGEATDGDMFTAVRVRVLPKAS
jgi:hypothetical protein